MSSDTPSPAIYVDADACPVKDEALRVAERHGLPLIFVSNAWMRLPDSPLVRRVVVPEGADAADDWIAERIGPLDIAVTADIPLAARCLKMGAQAIGPTGKPFTEAGIGMALAMRDLSAHLRETGESKGYNAGFTRQDRSRFLEALELAARRAIAAAAAAGGR
ncbi:MAG: YaiI/YqxD family protein [Hyphomicrobium sp.]